MKTVFGERRMDYTKRAHKAAQEQSYRPMFGGTPVTFEDTVGTTRDLEYAIDCQLAVEAPGLRAPLRFAVQERWRRPEHMAFGDITVTEWNLSTNQPSELHKLGAHLFVYGFYDDASDRVNLGVAIDVAHMLRALAMGMLPYKRRSRIDQSFLGFAFRDLSKIGAVAFKLDNRRTDGWETPDDLAALCRDCHHNRHVDLNGEFWADPQEMEQHWAGYFHELGKES